MAQTIEVVTTIAHLVAVVAADTTRLTEIALRIPTPAPLANTVGRIALVSTLAANATQRPTAIKCKKLSPTCLTAALKTFIGYRPDMEGQPQPVLIKII